MSDQPDASPPVGPARDEPVRDAPLGDVEAVILRLVNEAGAGKTVGPPEIARVLEPSTEWHRMMTPIRRAAIALAKAGRIVITRKGKPVDPDDFKGVYRLGLPRHD